jgi:hypothetical protein
MRPYDPNYAYSPIPAYNPAASPDTSYVGGFGIPSNVRAGGLPGATQHGLLDTSRQPFPIDPNLPVTLDDLLAWKRSEMARIAAQTGQLTSGAKVTQARLATDQGLDVNALKNQLASQGASAGGAQFRGVGNIKTDYGRQRQDLATGTASSLEDLARQRGDIGRVFDTKSAQAYIDAANYSAGQVPSSYSAAGWGVHGWGPAGAPYANDLFKTVSALFPGLQNYGEYSDRNIRGTNQLSTHALGNAIDIHPQNQAEGLKLYAWLKANQGAWGIQTVLYDPAGAPGINPGDHMNHIHIDWGYSPWTGYGGSAPTGSASAPTSGGGYGPASVGAGYVSGTPSSSSSSKKKKPPVGGGGTPGKAVQ